MISLLKRTALAFYISQGRFPTWWVTSVEESYRDILQIAFLFATFEIGMLRITYRRSGKIPAVFNTYAYLVCIQLLIIANPWKLGFRGCKSTAPLSKILIPAFSRFGP